MSKSKKSRKCRLCRANPADQTGSHVIPHFLMKRIDNHQSSGKRDYEVGFKVSGATTKPYIGRSILPEVIKEIHGDITFTDEQLESMSPPVIIDNILCTKCEKKIGKIESLYSTQNYTTKNSIITGDAPPILGMLFWYSILWRASISKEFNFKLQKHHNKQIRKFLNKYLTRHLQDKCDEVDNTNKCRLGYMLIRSTDYSNEHGTSIAFHNKHENPYCLLIDEYCVFFQPDVSADILIAPSFFELQNRLASTPINRGIDQEKILFIDHKSFHLHMDYYSKFIANQKIEGLFELLDATFNALTGISELPLQINHEVLQTMVMNNKKAIGQKYTIDHFSEASLEVLTKHKLIAIR